MHVPLTIGDFLERAALVHGADRVAVVDEPGVAGSLGAITYAEMHDRARGMALALDAMGVGHGERVAIVSPNSARFLISYFGVSGFGRVLVPVNFRLNADEVAYIVEHSGASVLLVDPEIERPWRACRPRCGCCSTASEDAELFAPAPAGCPAGTLGRRRGRHVLDQLHLGDDGAPEGCAADPPELLAQRRGLRMAHHGERSRHVAAHPAHVPLQRLGHALRGDGHGWHATSWCARSTARRS